MPHFTELPDTGFLRLSSIIAPRGPIPVSKSTWWAGIKDGRFPKPVKLGARITVWRVDGHPRPDRARGALAMARRSSSRGVKLHWNYSVEEAARATGNCKGTVRRWLKDGLPAITDQKPLLILGGDLIDYLKRQARSQAEVPPARMLLLLMPRAKGAGLRRGRIVHALVFQRQSPRLVRAMRDGHAQAHLGVEDHRIEGACERDDPAGHRRHRR